MNLRFSNRNRGVTLIELMIVLSIVGILVGFAGPQYGDFMKRQSVLSESRRITSILKLARSEARARATYVTISRSGSDWSSTIQVYESQELIRNDTSSGRVLAATVQNTALSFLSFNPRGWPRVAFSIAICKTTADATHGRLIEVNRVGKITEGPIGNASCT